MKKNQFQYSINDKFKNSFMVFKKSVTEIEEYIVILHNEKTTNSDFYVYYWNSNKTKRNLSFFIQLNMNYSSLSQLLMHVLKFFIYLILYIHQSYIIWLTCLEILLLHNEYL